MKYAAKNYIYSNNAKDYHEGIPYENFSIDNFNKLTKIESTKSFQHQVAAFRFENKISLVKYYLNTGNENEDHYVCITHIVDNAHDSNTHTINRTSNQFQNLYGQGLRNSITSIAFAYNNHTDEEKNCNDNVSISASPLMQKSTKKRSTHFMNSINFSQKVLGTCSEGEPACVFTGDLIGIIKQWNFKNLTLIRTFDLWKNHGIYDLGIVSNKDLHAGDNYDSFQNGWTVISAHYDSSLRKFNATMMAADYIEALRSYAKSSLDSDHPDVKNIIYISNSYPISAMKIGIFDNEMMVAVGTSHGILKLFMVKDFHDHIDFKKFGTLNSSITNIIFAEDFMYIGDANGSIKKVFFKEIDEIEGHIIKFVHGKIERYPYVKMNFSLPEPIKYTALSPDRQFLCIAGYKHLKMIDVGTNAPLKQWKINEHEKVRGLIYTTDSIIVIDKTGIKMRFDTNFAIENKKKVSGTNVIYAFCFTHKNDMNSSIYMLGDYGESYNSCGKHKAKLSIKKIPYGKNQKLWDRSEESDYGDVDTDSVETFRDIEGYNLTGQSYVIALTPDDKMLVATTYNLKPGNFNELTIQIYSTKDQNLLYYYTIKGSCISNVIFDNSSKFMFVSFFKNNVVSFSIGSKDGKPLKKEPIDLKSRIINQGFLVVDRSLSSNRLSGMCLTKDEVFLIIQNKGMISIHLSGIVFKPSKNAKQEIITETARSYSKKKDHEQTCENKLKKILRLKFPLFYTYKEENTCVICDTDPKYFYIVTKRGTLVKYMISQTYSYEGSTYEFPLLTDILSQKHLIYVNFENVKSNIIPIQEVKFKNLDPSLPLDETAQIFAYYPNSTRKKHEKRVKTYTKFYKLFKKDADISKIEGFLSDKNMDEIQNTIETIQSEKDVIPTHDKKVAPNNIIPTVGSKIISETMASHSCQKQLIEETRTYSYETRCMDNFIGKEHFQIFWYCQGNISVYNSDLKFAFSLTKRETIMSSENINDERQKKFGIFNEKQYKCYTEEVVPKNQFKISNDSGFVVMNCYNENFDELNMFELDSFFYNGQSIEKTANYCHSTTVRYYNIFKGMNFFTSYILEAFRKECLKLKQGRAFKQHEESKSKIERDENKILEFFSNHFISEIKLPGEFETQCYHNTGNINYHNISNYDKIVAAFEEPKKIIQRFESLKIISECDCMTMINTLSFYGHEEQIPKFIEIVLKNNQASTPDFSFFLKILGTLSSYARSGTIQVLVENQFVIVPEFYATKKLLKKKFLLSRLTPKNYPESEDLKTFDLRLDTRNPMEADLYKHRLPIALSIPDTLFYEYLNFISEIDSDSDIWENDLLTDYLTSIWEFYQFTQILYLIFSAIPLFCMFVTVFYMKDGKKNKALSQITSITTLCLNLYEVIQMISSPGWNYLTEGIVNYVDVLAQSLTQIFSLYNLFADNITCKTQEDGTEKCVVNDTTITLYILAFILQTFKFYLNLKGVNQVRNLSYKITEIVQGISAFFQIVSIFLLGSTNIFYVTEFSQEGITKYTDYQLDTYYIFFGAFTSYGPKSPSMNWVNFLL